MAGDEVDDDGDEVNDNGDGAKLSLPSMHRRLCRCRNGVVTLVVMASLPSPMCRRLAAVDDDGDGVTGDNDDNYFDDATNFAVVAMVLLPSSRWRRTMATARRATESMTIDDGDSATGYDDDGNDDGRRRQRKRRQRKRQHELNDERRGRQLPRATIAIAMMAKTHAHR